MKRSITGILAVLIVLALASCNRGDEAEASTGGGTSANATQDNANTVSDNSSDSVFDNSYEGALPPTNQIMLGILSLEGTDDAVNGAQAATMLPLWQALQSGSIQNQSERAAILRQIESALTDAQIEAIGAMRLTFTDMNDWAAANGVELPQFGQGGQGGEGGQGGRGGALADMSEEERAAFREEMQNLSPDERRVRLQEMGIELPENAGAGGPQAGQGGPRAGGRFNVLMTPLIELLQSRATI